MQDISPSELIAALFELEMQGLVKQLPGKNLLKCGNVTGETSIVDHEAPVRSGRARS